MSLHLIKLCVGVDSVDDLEEWVARRRREKRRSGRPLQQVHVTRMTPKRSDELLDGGSLYWVIRGSVQARQRLVGIEPFVDADGIRRCRLVMEPEVIRTRLQPRRPFQGWRYLKGEDVPADLGQGDDPSDLPAELSAELAALGLQ